MIVEETYYCGLQYLSYSLFSDLLLCTDEVKKVTDNNIYLPQTLGQTHLHRNQYQKRIHHDHFKLRDQCGLWHRLQVMRNDLVYTLHYVIAHAVKLLIPLFRSNVWSAVVWHTKWLSYRPVHKLGKDMELTCCYSHRGRGAPSSFWSVLSMRLQLRTIKSLMHVHVHMHTEQV